MKNYLVKVEERKEQWIVLKAENEQDATSAARDYWEAGFYSLGEKAEHSFEATAAKEISPDDPAYESYTFVEGIK